MQVKYHNKGGKLLLDWMEENQFSLSKFSRRLDLDYSIVRKWIVGYTLPSLKSALLVQEVTGGKVKCTDWTSTNPKKKNKNTSPNKQTSTDAKNDGQNLEDLLKSH
jgi:hypothetical protein